MLTTRVPSVSARLRLATAPVSSLRCFASSSSSVALLRFPSRPLLARATSTVLPSAGAAVLSHRHRHRPVSTTAERVWRPPPVELGRPIESYFGVNVFDRNKLRASISSEAFISYMNSVQTDTPIEAGVADAIATSLLAWAKERGATHYTHWFQPLTGGTAEKHDTFLDPRPDGAPLTRFRGKELITGEPDGSSFPTGGLRATHGARGYTCWDPQSPPFILNNGHTNGGTLYIPSLFYSWKDGHALDDKTPLLRANQALQAQALKVFRALGDTETTSVHADAGLEQEFFLIKREYFLKRTDLLLTGRTLLGASPPKGQEMEDQYFGHPPEAAIDAIHEFEIEMWKLGVPLMTRHREVAPGQYEIAPKFAPSNIACDRNLIMMEMLKKVARRHGLAALIHEKPFSGVNGSGKHNNWSLGTNKIPTLYQPSDNPHTDIYFMLFLGATMRALDKHSDLMRVAISSAGNDHRLGAHEAPPAIVSAYLGDDINESVEKFIRGDKTPSTLNLNVNLGVGTLPRLKRVATDRNRTSAFAFTSNKFEFRAVGAPQNPSRSCMVISTIMADSLRDVAAELTKLKKQGKSSDQAVEAVARQLLNDHKRVIFNGNNYSPEWIKEAERRGLLNLRTTPAALKHFASPKNIELFKSLGVLNQDEVKARASVMYEEYVKRILIEAKTVTNMAATQVVPAATTAQTELAESIRAAQTVSGGTEFTQQKKQLGSLSGNIETLLKESDRVRELIHNAHSQGSEEKSAEFCEKQIIPAMKSVREAADAIERVVPAKTWPMPTYHDILFHQD